MGKIHVVIMYRLEGDVIRRCSEVLHVSNVMRYLLRHAAVFPCFSSSLFLAARIICAFRSAKLA